MTQKERRQDPRVGPVLENQHGRVTPDLDNGEEKRRGRERMSGRPSREACGCGHVRTLLK